MAARTIVSLALLAAAAQAQVAPPPVTPERDEAHPGQSVVIRGTAVAVDVNGVAHAQEDGFVRALQWPVGVVEIPVRSGRFEAKVGGEAPIEMSSLILGGRAVDLEIPKIPPPFDAAIDLRGKWIADWRLHVVDADSDGDVELQACEWAWFPGSMGCPDIDATRDRPEERAVGVDSPIALTRSGRYRIRAPGHAWRTIPNFWIYGWSAMSEAKLELPPACSLDVVLPAAGGGAPRFLVFDSDRDPGWMSLPAPASRTIHLDSLPPGELHLRWVLSFDLRPWFRNEVALAEATVKPKPGPAARVVLGPEVNPDGLLDDGTVERDGEIFIARKDGVDLKPSGTLTLTCWGKPRFGERSDSRSGLVALYRLDRDGLGFLNRSARSIRCDVQEGRFHLRVPWECMVRIDEATLDGLHWPIALGQAPLLFETTRNPIEVAVPDFH